jgi:uncharacterized protein (TIGR00290 family)
MTVFVCWSGGKEAALAFYKLRKEKDFKILYLLNMVSEDGKYSRSHGRINTSLLKAQAEAIEVPILQRKTTWEKYEEEFKKVVLELKEQGIQAGVFGDIDLQEHRDWIERICKSLNIKPILPLWKEEREALLWEFIHLGFQATVVAVKKEFLGKEWLSRQIDEKFIKDLKLMNNVDLCGERGEYHTFVYNGPIFKHQVAFKIGRKILKDKYWFLELY